MGFKLTEILYQLFGTFDPIPDMFWRKAFPENISQKLGFFYLS